MEEGKENEIQVWEHIFECDYDKKPRHVMLVVKGKEMRREMK